MSGNDKLQVAILWHMHQPFYLNPEENRFDMPWVRFHGIKDYLDMPLLASRYEDVKVTFNLVPSLLDQIEMYCHEYTDRHLDLSRLSARRLTPEQRKEILETFFSAHYPTMIEPYSRYRQLYRKKESCGDDLDLAIEIFSTSEWRDLQVWSNLVWVDEMFRAEEPVRQLLEKGRDFTGDERDRLLDFQISLMKRIIPTYQQLYKEGKIDLSFTPYYHPILPLLVDTESAKESLPDADLPHQAFRFPEDASWHVEQSASKFRNLFGDALSGMWPSEGSVSEAVLRLMAKAGLTWAATDEEILTNSLLKSGLNPRKYSQHRAYVFAEAPSLKLFFRDRGLSDKIGFVYSGWSAERSVADFLQQLRQIRESLTGRLDEYVVPIILDGENAWEYFPNDGKDFLEKLYEGLADDQGIETISFPEAARRVTPISLPSVHAGSWINHNFSIWIGHPEDNAAWDLLFETRQALTEFERKNPDAPRETLEQAWRQIHIAEGSDWCWWYGDEHIGAFNDRFDRLFRKHLKSVYTILGIEPPESLAHAIFRGKTESFLVLPESLVTPNIDGLLTHYYEWSGAGHYDCRRAGGAMHRTNCDLADVYFAFDYERFYIRLDFAQYFRLVGSENYRAVIDLSEVGRKEIDLHPGACGDSEGFRYCFDRILEMQFERKSLFVTGCGIVKFFILLFDGEELLEKWPAKDPIVVDIPERDQEIFWQV
ncbi:MAG: glycoside hydrolase [Candidatus Zixiibacteriota bacterium]|nr:MAG: glycoside hydrolase [candidate division Zixibacteria bacterium]